MKKGFWTIFVSIAFGAFSCNPQKADTDPVEYARLKDSIVTNLMNNSDSITRSVLLSDTAYDPSCPVMIISAKPETQEYSNYRDIAIVYKNISSKNISAIRFKWYGVNAFNKPADMGVLDNGMGGGFDDQGLDSRETSRGSWSLLSRDLKRVVKAWVTEVAFTDGTNWKRKSLF